MSFTTTDPGTLCLADNSCRLNITIQDNSVSPAVNADPDELRFILTDTGGTIVSSDVYPSPASRIVRTAVGQFYVDIGPFKAKLNGLHAIGSNTLTVDGCSPLTTSYWPSTGELVLDYGIIGLQETVSYSALSLVAGAGTFTLSTPTTIQHADNASIRGPNCETNSYPELIAMWKVRLTPTSEWTDILRSVRIVSTRVASYIPLFRQMIDKSHKLVDQTNDCFLGYTDAQLMGYIDGGLQTINAYQPSVTFDLETFPSAYRQILIDAALITGVTSQQLFAVDTDIPNYNDQGTSFVISHQPQLAGFLNQITQRLDKLIPMMKLQLIRSGAVHVQMGSNYRFATLLDAAPSGALFRNLYFKG